MSELATQNDARCSTTHIPCPCRNPSVILQFFPAASRTARAGVEAIASESAIGGGDDTRRAESPNAIGSVDTAVNPGGATHDLAGSPFKKPHVEGNSVVTRAVTPLSWRICCVGMLAGGVIASALTCRAAQMSAVRRAIGRI